MGDPKQLSEMEDRDLKAMAYDELLKLDTIKRNIALIQEELGRRHGTRDRIEGSASGKKL